MNPSGFPPPNVSTVYLILEAVTLFLQIYMYWLDASLCKASSGFGYTKKRRPARNCKDRSKGRTRTTVKVFSSSITPHHPTPTGLIQPPLFSHSTLSPLSIPSSSASYPALRSSHFPPLIHHHSYCSSLVALSLSFGLDWITWMQIIECSWPVKNATGVSEVSGDSENNVDLSMRQSLCRPRRSRAAQVCAGHVALLSGTRLSRTPWSGH